MSKTPSDKRILAALEKYGSERKAAKKLGMPRSTFKDNLRRIQRSEFSERARHTAKKIKTPKRGVKRFILSAAQDGTQVDEKFLANLEAYAFHVRAKIMIAPFTYGTTTDGVYHELVRPYLTRTRQDIGGKLLFCAEVNTVPTAVNPLSGMETYTRSQWGVFPHPKVQLTSVPTMKNTDAKMIMTTGVVTKPNYIQRKAGVKAEFHHVIAAVMVEIDADGDVFCRHLIADDEGNFQDLGYGVAHGVVTEGHAVDVITWGDIHHEKIDEDIAQACWGIDYDEYGVPDVSPNGPVAMVDELRPSYQVFHDIIDFRARNHHNVGDPHFIFEMYTKRMNDIKTDIIRTADFLHESQRRFATSVIVESNHDLALTRWLKEADYRKDPVNAEFFLMLQARMYRAIREDDNDFSPLRWSLQELGGIGNDVIFLDQEDSFRLKAVEYGMHGHLGANGSRAHANQFRKMGPKANVAHTHSAGIVDGIYTAGVSGKLDMGYNKGLSSWSHSHILTYPNGKRAIVTMQGKKWHA